MINFTTDLDPRSLAIHERALSKAKKYLVAEAELLHSIIEVDLDRTYEKVGLTHLTPYCVKHLGLSADVAGIFVRVARKTHLVPQLKTAIEEGRLSVHKAKTIASVVTTENHTEWIDKASTLTKEKLEREVATASPSAPKPERAKATGEDRFRVEFELNSEQMELFRRAQNLASAKLKKSTSLAETMALLLNTFLNREDRLRKAARSNPDRSRDGSHLSARVQHAVHLRDRGQCQARIAHGEICGESRWTHLHHIILTCDGGANTLENLTTLCSSHHRMWHKREDNIPPAFR